MGIVAFLQAHLLVVIIIAAIAVVVILVVLYVKRKKKQSEEKKYYDAAGRMIKENCLDEIISSRGKHTPVGKKTMIYIRINQKPPQGFVFDPEKGIRIGRDPATNEICIRDNVVSSSHCCIYLSQGQPVVQDYNSSNGTWLKRGVRKTRVNGVAHLRSGDRLRVGKTTLEIKFFTYDMMNL